MTVYIFLCVLRVTRPLVRGFQVIMGLYGVLGVIVISKVISRVLVIVRWVLECSAGHQAISRSLGCFGRIVLGVELYFRGSGVV